VASPKQWNEIYIVAHRMIQISVGADKAIQATFAAYNTDGKTNFVCPYIFYEQTPANVTQELDDVMAGKSKLPHSKSVIGIESAAVKYAPANPIALDGLTGGHSRSGNIGIAQQRYSDFLVRVTIDLNANLDGQSFHGFMLPFGGTAPKELIGKTLRGVFAPIRTVVSMTPWVDANRIMDGYFSGW
jgi:hypothetical protein